MRILNVSALYPPYVIGGAELACQNVSNELANRGHDVYVITLQPPEVKVEEAQVDGVHVHYVPLANLYWPYDPTSKSGNSLTRLAWHTIDSANHIMARRVSHLVAEINPDVVLTHNLQGFSSAVLPEIKRHKLPLIHVIHDFSFLCVRTALYRNSQRCDAGTKGRCRDCRVLTRTRTTHAKAVDSVVSVSTFAIEKHQEHGLFQQIPGHVIPNALRGDLAYVADARTRNQTERLRFGYLGRIDKPKGIETLLIAAGDLEDRGHDFELVVAGAGAMEYQQELQKRWPSRKNRFIGFVSPEALFAQIDVLIFPSESYETFGSVVVEAYSQGIPVVASRCGGTTDTVNHGQTGFLTRSGDAEDLASAMEKFLCDHRLLNTFSRNAIATNSEFSIAVQADRYLAAIEETLTGSAE